MRLRAAVIVILGVVLATGCGPGVRPGTSAVSIGPVTRSAAPPSGAPSSAGGPSSAGAASSAGAPTASATAQCAVPPRLGAGVSVAAWRLGAIRFVSPRSGIALTAPQVPCDRSLGPERGIEVTFLTQPVRLAVTEDGGRHWVTRGSALPASTQSSETEQVAAVSGPDVWVVSGTGVLFATRDYGATWTAQPLPAPVVAAASAGGWLWALSCPAVSDNLCQPVVERMRLPGGRWTRTPLAAPASLMNVQLTVLSGRAALVVIWAPHAELASTTDGGAHWLARAVPDGPPIPCGRGLAGSFTAAGPGDWWLLCPGGAAAGSTTRALWRSTDAGRTWTAVTAITSLAGPRRAGSLPYQDGAVIAAGSPDRLWIVTPNTMSVSTDGGAFWSTIQLDADGLFGQFDVLSGTVAWMLGPGTGLWQTTDGTTWRSIGGASPLADPVQRCRARWLHGLVKLGGCPISRWKSSTTTRRGRTRSPASGTR
jgi:hypothetical protein